jgi:hypothetical protein
VSKLSLVRSSLEGCNGIVGVKAVGERSNNGSRTLGFNITNGARSRIVRSWRIDKLRLVRSPMMGAHSWIDPLRALGCKGDTRGTLSYPTSYW